MLPGLTLLLSEQRLATDSSVPRFAFHSQPRALSRTDMPAPVATASHLAGRSAVVANGHQQAPVSALSRYLDARAAAAQANGGAEGNQGEAGLSFSAYLDASTRLHGSNGSVASQPRADGYVAVWLRGCGVRWPCLERYLTLFPCLVLLLCQTVADGRAWACADVSAADVPSSSTHAATVICTSDTPRRPGGEPSWRWDPPR